MRRIFFFIFSLLAVTSASLAQECLIVGKVIEKDTKNPIEQATVQLLRNDSSYITGAATGMTGSFKLSAPKNGNYILKLSYVGYKTTYCNVIITGIKSVSAGNIEISPDEIMPKGAEVAANLAKVQVKEDTFIYNADAYRLPKGSVIEELIKKIPGAQIDDDGNITINGKEVKKILVDGKEFFGGDTKTAIKNLPSSMIERIKAYDKMSDLAKITGIDDGDEETVLDLGIKPGMKKGVLTNNDVGIGNKDRYGARLMGSVFSDKFRMTAIANANNINDMGFPGGGGRSGSRRGLNSSKTAGLNFNYDDKKKFQMDGSVRWNHDDADAKTISSSENFVSTKSSFSNSIRNDMSRDNHWNANMRLEWKPDTMTDVLFRPSINSNTNDGYNTNISASYRKDPYSYFSDPLSPTAMAAMADDSVMVNYRNNNSISHGNNKSFNSELQYNRKLNNSGRNVTLRGTIGYGEADNNSLSISNVHIYQVKNKAGSDSTYQTNRFNVTPGKNWNYSIQATYSEPIMKATFLQFSYKFQYKYSKSDRSTYNFPNLGEDFFDGLEPEYGIWGEYLASLQNPYTDYEDIALSRYSEYKNYIHDIELKLRIIRTKYNLSLGVEIVPQKSHFIQEYRNIHTDTIRNMTNVTPTLDFRYKFSKLSQFRLNYYGATGQPNITDLLDITDDSNPLNIRKGNPGLKPSFTNTLRLTYNNNIKERQRTIMAHLNFSTTSNSISNMVEYDETTGGRTTRPENINGNWNANGTFLYNTAIDSDAFWNFSTYSSIRYNHYVGYVTLNSKSDSQKNITRTATYNERLEGGYRNDWLEFDINGSVIYTNTRNLLQSKNNLDTWRYSYGASTNITLPWGTRISTDISENSRRGYNDASMNTNELIWNEQISQDFLSDKSLTVSLQLYDILNRQSNYSRTINSMMRSDTEYNAITNFAMLHVIYRIKYIGGKRIRANANKNNDDKKAKNKKQKS